MGFFGDSGDKRTVYTNKVNIDNTNDLKVQSNEILSILIVIAVFLFILVILRIVSMIKKSTKRQATRDQILLNRMPNHE